MLRFLRDRELRNEPLRIAVIGAGSMGRGVVCQLASTPGMRVSFIADTDLGAAREAARLAGLEVVETRHRTGPLPVRHTRVGADPLALLADEEIALDAVVEATNSIVPAARYCLAAIRRSCHVVLMNAEVDLAFGRLLQAEAATAGVVVTSDAGDQHGVLATMIDEIELWGFEILMAGNIKGFLDRDATPESIGGEAAKRDLNPIQCCAYTDGTKLNVEMALVSNGTGLIPPCPGMRGPRCAHVGEVFTCFDFDTYGETGQVDYVLGAEPGGGVFVVARNDGALPRSYMRYYKMGEGPHYLFYRPYHLCHFETGRAVAKACLNREPILTPRCGRVSDVFAYAKRDLPAGHVFAQAIGGADLYGLIHCAEEADRAGQIPIALLEGHGARAPLLTRRLRKGEPLLRADVTLRDSALLELMLAQEALGSDSGGARHRPALRSRT